MDINYEEKYEEALERARKIHRETEFDYEKGMMEEIFPELEESEDEKIKHEIKIILANTDFSRFALDYTFADMIAWLEKQGEFDNNDTGILNRFSFYSYKDEPNILYLSELYVNKEQRNKGIGTKILKIADEIAANMKCNSIRLKTEIGSNAERLYRKNGYNSLKMEGNQIWLEKQGEQKPIFNTKHNWYVSKVDGKIYDLNYNPTDKIEPKFKVGDWIIFNENHNSVYQIERIDNYRYYLRHYLGGTLSVHRDCELIRLWSIEDAKPGDVLAINWHEGDDSWEKIIMFVKYHNPLKGWISTSCVEGYGNTFKNGKLAFEGEEVLYYSKTWTANLHPATKEQRDTLKRCMTNAGYR